MKNKIKNMIFGIRASIRIAIATCLILLVPLFAMQFTDEVNWDKSDFIVMGFLLFSTGNLFVLISRKLPRKYRVIIGAMLLVAFLYIWAELAVGIFTNLGS